MNHVANQPYSPGGKPSQAQQFQWQRLDSHYPEENRPYQTYYTTEDLLAEDLRAGFAPPPPLPDEDALSRRRFWRRVQGFIIFISLVMMLAMGVLILPPYLGILLPYVPQVAFVHARILQNQNTRNIDFEAYDRYLNNNTIYPGIYIDGVHVGDMTREAAISAVNHASPVLDGKFSYTVTVAGQDYLIDSDSVPYTRNTEDVVAQAYAFGRTLTYQDQSNAPTPFQARVNAAIALRGKPEALYTSITYDRATLRQFAFSIAAAHTYDPVSATVASFDFSTKSFTFTDDRNGSALNGDDVYHAITSRLDQGILEDRILIYPEVLLASTTKQELMNNFRRISTFTTTTTKDKNRNTNVMLSAQAINGKTILPGETFSFNQTTGQRTAEKGYQMAVAIAGGQSIPDIGGGVCQTSTTLFNAVTMADLEIVKRAPHAWPASYVEKGLDATVNWPNLDFQFRNNSDWPVFIVSTYADRKITVEIYGNTLRSGTSIQLETELRETINPPTEINYVQNPELPPGTTKPTIKARKGYVVDTYKVTYQGGQIVNREKLFTTTYKMYQETVEYN